MKGKLRGSLSAVLTALIMTAIPMGHAYATSTQEKLNQAENEKKETQSQLNETKEDLEDLRDEKSNLESKLSDLNNQLTKVSNNLSDLESQIEVKEEEIRITEEDLVKAKETESWQYESMKARIQFMYEQRDYLVLESLFGSDTFAEALNKAQYVKQIAEYDRKKLDEYEDTRAMIEEEEARLREEREVLETLKTKAEEEKSKVNFYVKQTSGSIKSYSGQISEAEAKALAYEAQIKEQEANIEYLKKKLEEERALSNLAAQSKWRDISEVQFEEGDRKLLANIIYCEAGAEPYAGQVAVGAVVINRVLSTVFPDTVVGVIYQNRQFSPVASGRLALALAEDRATDSCYQAADEAMRGQTNVGNCVFFRTPIEGLTGIQIGGHIFY